MYPYLHAYMAILRNSRKKYAESHHDPWSLIDQTRDAKGGDWVQGPDRPFFFFCRVGGMCADGLIEH